MRGTAISVLLLLAACGRTDGGPPPPAGPPAGRVRFVLSGDTRGFLVPCGCASKQLGGVPRRAAFLETLPSKEVVYLDAGGTPHRATEYDRLKAGFIWRGMASAGLAAANVGASEAAQGREALAARSDLPFVSCNVVADTGAAVVAPERRLERSGARIGVLGVLSARHAAGPGLRILDPADALRGPVARLRPDVDLLVLLADAPEEELVALAQGNPELDAVLATGPTQPLPPRLVEGRTVLAGTSNKGKFVVEVPFEAQARHDRRPRWTPGTGRVVELSEDFGEPPAMQALVKDYQAALRAAALPPERTGEVATLLSSLPGDYRYAGSEKCGTCHTPDAGIWAASKHAHGYETLVAKGFEADAYCVRCHTTGYGGPGGFRGPADAKALGGVGCESCHGPSKAHAEAPLQVRTPAKAAAACLSCHDPENSPHFDYATFWPRIVHGRGRRPQEAPR